MHSSSSLLSESATFDLFLWQEKLATAGVLLSLFPLFSVSTQIGHDSEDKTLVDGFDNAREYSRSVYYDASLPQIEALISLSNNCKQFIKVIHMI